jgi:cytochrome c-type biogenesis protein CcmH/NrfF
LWGLPPAVLLLGMLALIVVVRRRSTTPAAEMANLTAAEEARLSDLLHREN